MQAHIFYNDALLLADILPKGRHVFFVGRCYFFIKRNTRGGGKNKSRPLGQLPKKFSTTNKCSGFAPCLCLVLAVCALVAAGHAEPGRR